MKPTPRAFWGHPAGLLTAFLTEVCARFGWYGMSTIALLFLVDDPAGGGLGLAPATATGMVVVYLAVAYLAGIPGGWLADRLIGTRRAVLVGGVTVAAGQYLLAIPAVTAYLGLLLGACGAGLLRPAISSLVGELYDRRPDADHARRDAGFTLVYLGINMGGWLGALVVAWLGTRQGWPVGFAAAGAATTLAMVAFLVTGRLLGDAGRTPSRPLDEYRRGPVMRRAAVFSGFGLIALAAAVALLSLAAGRSPLGALLLLTPPILIVVPFAVFSTMFGEHTLTAVERSRLRAYVPMFCAAAVFWLMYGQAADLLHAFVPDPPGAFRIDLDSTATRSGSAAPLLVVLFAPGFAWLWTRLGARAPGAPLRFAGGLLAVGASVAILGIAGPAAATGRISAWWLLPLLTVLALTELLVSPVGLSLTTRLAPPRFAARMMGVWYLAAAAGVSAGGYLARLRGELPEPVYCGLLATLAGVAGVLLVVAAPRISRLCASAD